MIITYNWLKEFVDVDLPPANLGDLLTMLGLEVESMESHGEGMDDVVVAVVEEVKPHPNADKLSLCLVNNGKELLSVVCGAKNFKPGDKVALAQIGASLPGDFKIKHSKIRGEESLGMLCSEKELGLADESAGIMVLPNDLILGIPLFDALGIKDTIFEIGLTPNRADCLSIIGIAREVAAKLGEKVKSPEQHLLEKGDPINDVASVEVKDFQFCPRYTARYISGCKVAPSPQWLVNRLKSVGLRSINNIVDITNYVLMEYGHPLHAFDFNLISGGKIIVRRAGEGESFTTLDGQNRSLKSTDLTICDASKVVALAGIMGGENSEISDATTSILLESAYFTASSIRLTSKRLGLHTESSHRFERGADVRIVTKALDRAACLIAELTGGSIAKGILDVHDEIPENNKIVARVDFINNLLGTELPENEIKHIFQSLEFKVKAISPGVYDVEAPSFRVDIEREIDLVEEVARFYGYDKIPTSMPKARVFSDLPTKHQLLEQKTKDLLVAHGFNEVINFSFIAPDLFDKILLGSYDFRRDSVKVLNPLVTEQSVMRTILLPGILETSARNINFRNLNLRIFEMRRVYLPIPGKDLPDEPLHVAGLLSGLRSVEGWNQDKSLIDFFDAKGVVENLLLQLHVHGVVFTVTNPETFYHPGKACSIECNGDLLGSLGELHPTVQESFSLDKPCYYFELNFEKLVHQSRDDLHVHAPPRYPDTFRDIALLVADEIPVADILNCVKNLKEKEVVGVDVFDLYKGDHVPTGLKSVAIRVRYRLLDRTLTDEEVNCIHTRIIGSLVNKLNATIR